LTSERRASLGAEGRRGIMGAYSIDQVVAKWEALYSAFLNPPVR